VTSLTFSRTKVLLATDAVLAPETVEQIKARFLSQRGADVADLVDIAMDADIGLEHTEPAWEEWGDEARHAVQVARGVDDNDAGYLVSVAMMTLVLAEERLTLDRVRDLAGSLHAHAVGA
jgi:hypothetical protein